MALRKVFKPGANTDETKTTSIGSSEMFVRNSRTEEELKNVQKVIDTPVSMNTESKTEEIMSTIGPKINQEELIDRSLLITAPEDWNFFAPPDDQSYSMLLSSIYNDGLMHPITVWEQADGTYMILSGHTRERCYDDLYQVVTDEEKERFKSIPCKVYSHESLTENDARRIIILANVAQRAKESRGMQIKSIKELATLEKSRSKWGTGVDINLSVSKLLNCSRSSVCFYKRISNDLIDEFFDLFCKGKISRRLTEVLTMKNKTIQKHVLKLGYELFETPKMRNKLRNAVSTQDLDDIVHKNKDLKRKAYTYTVSTPLQKHLGQQIIPLVTEKEDVSSVASFLKEVLPLAVDYLSPKAYELFAENVKALNPENN